MIVSRPLAKLTFVAALAFLGGCSGATPEIDNAEVIKTPAKPVEGPAPTPEAPPAKDVPKG